ncbi:hypothetical protein [Mycobacterium spongiae]|uniref:Uncharacterized protein n=1 Tax=Mycobacterium spongiae TaxID=886343 RepID=A0A975JYQ5_9MYCO|nr:hypothetical protein [Mycobacterium spongiae]QUR68152.1 hypothetical protein F6B93_14615 [Mycobacterium spongiae]
MTPTDEHWLPLGIEGDEAVTFTAPWTEIPDWFQESLWKWIAGILLRRNSYGGEGSFDAPRIRQAERVLHVTLPHLEDHNVNSGPGALRERYDQLGPAALLAFVDFLMSDLPVRHAYLDILEQILVEAGSGWRVSTRAGKSGLVKRLPAGVTDATAAIVQRGKGGKRLAEAWEAAFGINPNPSQAYRLAVKAVEAASAPVVIPKDPDPSMGKVIGRMLQGGQFRLPHLREEPNGVTSHDVLLYNLKQLWWGQHDRHDGLPESSLPDDVTQDEAESAVLLAVTLVGWFETGKVQP